MCGIAGLIGFGQESDVRRMCAIMRHRGPDDEGYYTNGQACLGMVRLSVIDVAGGHQPMTDERQRFHIVFNGEIYNYQALRKHLIDKGHQLKTNSDTEVIVHLYEDEQEQCLKRLNGDFSIAIWDRQEQTLFLARDRFGVKPLYYWHEGDQFAFSSELKALLHLPVISRELSSLSIDAYLTFLYIPAPHTIFRAIKKLPAGHSLSFSKGRMRIHPYWQLPDPSSTPLIPAVLLAEKIRDQLRLAVHRRLVSDVPLGAFLSGGIDSSAVVAFMREASAKPVETFSIGFEAPDNTYNELPAARQTAKVFGTNHHEFVVKPDIAQLLPEVVWHLDEPFADSSSLLTFLISREAKKYVTVALTGVGGDELFGGYPRYLAAKMSMQLEKIPQPIRQGLGALAGYLPESATTYNTAGRIKRFLRGLALPADERYLSWVAQLLPSQKEALYTREFAARLHYHSGWVNYHQMLSLAVGDYLDRVSRLDLETYLPDDLLMLGDKMSMAHALEIRVPFCDHELAEMATVIPMHSRLAGGKLKGLLRLALKGVLPEALLNKPKQGFMLPLAAWLRGPLAALCDDLLAAPRIQRRGWLDPAAVVELVSRQRKGETNLSHRIYALMVLELWCQRYVDA